MWPDECYLRPTPKGGGNLVFAIYYRKPDDDMAFRRAARTWCTAMLETFSGASVRMRLLRAKTVKDLTDRWAEINAEARSGNLSILCGNVLTHADKFGLRPGLEMASDGGPDSTLEATDIAGLPRLPWARHALLVLSGCGTGLPMRGSKHSMARHFAQTQAVNTIGQQGYASFSRNWSSWREITAEDEDIHLWAYRGRKNFAELPLPHTTVPTAGRIPGQFIVVHT